MARVELSMECAADDLRIGCDGALDGDEMLSGKLGVSVMEEQDVATGGSCAGVHLAASVGAVAAHDVHIRKAAGDRGAIAGARGVGDNDLMPPCHRRDARQALL